MLKQKHNQRKLALNMQTIRALSGNDLLNAMGGNIRNTTDCTGGGGQSNGNSLCDSCSFSVVSCLPK